MNSHLPSETIKITKAIVNTVLAYATSHYRQCYLTNTKLRFSVHSDLKADLKKIPSFLSQEKTDFSNDCFKKAYFYMRFNISVSILICYPS